MLDAPTLEDLEQVFLSRLTEGESIERKIVLQSAVPGAVGAQRERKHGSVDLGWSRVDPMGSEFAEVRPLIETEFVGAIPW